jgi:hypothetical protein
VVARIKRAADTILERQIGIALLLICIPIKAERSKPALVSREVQPRYCLLALSLCELQLKSAPPWWKVFNRGSITLDQVAFILRAVFGFDGRMLALAHLIDSEVSYSDRIAFARPR